MMKIWLIENSHYSYFVIAFAGLLALLGNYWSQWSTQQKDQIQKEKLLNLYYRIDIKGDFIEKDELIISAYNPHDMPIQSSYMELQAIPPIGEIINIEETDVSLYFKIKKYSNINIPPKASVEIDRISRPPFEPGLMFKINIYTNNGFFKELIKVITPKNWESNAGIKWIAWGQLLHYTKEGYKKICEFETHFGFPISFKNDENDLPPKGIGNIQE